MCSGKGKHEVVIKAIFSRAGNKTQIQVWQTTCFIHWERTHQMGEFGFVALFPSAEEDRPLTPVSIF